MLRPVPRKPNPCCNEQANLRQVANPAGERPDTVVHQCQKCGARHWTLTVEPVLIGVEGASL